MKEAWLEAWLQFSLEHLICSFWKLLEAAAFLCSCDSSECREHLRGAPVGAIHHSKWRLPASNGMHLNESQIVKVKFAIVTDVPLMWQYVGQWDWDSMPRCNCHHGSVAYVSEVLKTH